MRIIRCERVGSAYEVEVESADGRQHSWGFGPVPLDTSRVCGARAADDSDGVCVLAWPHDPEAHEWGSEQEALDANAQPAMSENEWVHKNLLELKGKVEPAPVDRVAISVPEQV